MGVFVGIVLVAVCIAGVVWNHKNSSEAMDGVEFRVSAPVARVSAAVQASYCTGMSARAMALLRGVKVTQLATGSFRMETKIGDIGELSLRSVSAAETVVRVRSTSLYIGLPPAARFKKGLLAAGAAMSHGIYTLLGIAPNAATMRRFQRGVENRIAKQLSKA